MKTSKVQLSLPKNRTIYCGPSWRKFIFGFISSVEVTSEGCWKWHGDTDRQGYATICVQKAARIAWILFYGEIPRGKCVLHTCDNPRCTNYTHLWLGTRGDNNTDRAIKGRNKFNWSTLTIPQVKSIRRKKDRGWTTSALARRYNVSAMSIYQIVTDNIKRRSYKYV